MAVASLVLGIVGVVFAFTGALSFISPILGIVGIVLAALGMKKQPEKKGLAVAGLVLSIICTALGLIMWLACMACASAVSSAVSGSDLKEFEQGLNELSDALSQLGGN